MSVQKSPSEVLIARNRAFADENFGFIYDTYHSESNFRRQFDNREGYIQTGRATLSKDYRIIDSKIIAEEFNGIEAQVIILIEMCAHGQLQKYAELIWMRQEDKLWRYHRGLKMTQDELPVDSEALTFADFAKLDQSTIF